MELFKKVIVALVLAGTLANGLEAAPRKRQRAVPGASTRDAGTQTGDQVTLLAPLWKRVPLAVGNLIIQSCQHPKQSVPAGLFAYLAKAGIKDALSFALPMKSLLIKGIGGIVFGLISFLMFKSLLKKEGQKQKTS